MNGGRNGLGGEKRVGDVEESIGPAVETLVERGAERAKGVKSIEGFHDAPIMHSPASSRTFQPPARLKRKLRVEPMGFEPTTSAVQSQIQDVVAVRQCSEIPAKVHFCLY